MSIVEINKALMKLSKRSEKADIEILTQAFVDVGPMFTLLSTFENQILFGRRGTGKTHALIYLSETVKRSGDIVVYIDLSNLGSSGGIYADGVLPIPERASRLLVDTLSVIHTDLLSYFVNNDDKFNLSQVGKELDSLAEAISKVRLSGELESEASSSHESNLSSHFSLVGGFDKATAKGSIEARESCAEKLGSSSKVKSTGSPRHVVHFGRVRVALEAIMNIVKPLRLWLLLDEWSSIPPDIQPYLADMFRRCFFPIRNLTTKIAAIEYRSKFKIPLPENDYIGFELGADISCNIDLDEFMVFDNNQERARSFYSNLFYKHLINSEEARQGKFGFRSEEDMINQAFSQKGTFDELVRAAEGVPRDAIYIASSSAQYAIDEKISVPSVRKAARHWYALGKESSVATQENTHKLLLWIIDKVISEKARAFLLRSNVESDLIRNLFDSRVLHVLKKNISSRDEPGVRYTAYKIDYGCYVHLMNTSKAPIGQFLSEDGDYIEVPPDDYRSIRRAIMDIDEFLKALEAGELTN